MKIDGYEVNDPNIADIIDKLIEADGSIENKVNYLIQASEKLTRAIAQTVEDETVEKMELNEDYDPTCVLCETGEEPEHDN